MSVENGLEKVQHARHNIKMLRNRVDFLTGRITARQVEGTEIRNGHDESELRALLWAIPVLEAEWDNLARLQRNVARIEGRSWVPPSEVEWELAEQ